MGLYDFSLYDIIVRNAVLFQNRPAWQDPDQQSPLTFAQVKQRVDRLALSLRKSGCRKGDRIGVMGKNCLEYFCLYGAAAALGAIVLPVNWRLSDAEAAYVLNDGAPQWVFADDDNPQWVEAVAALPRPQGLDRDHARTDARKQQYDGTCIETDRHTDPENSSTTVYVLRQTYIQIRIIQGSVL